MDPMPVWVSLPIAIVVAVGGCAVVRAVVTELALRRGSRRDVARGASAVPIPPRAEIPPRLY